MSRFLILPGPRVASQPLTACWDQVELGQSASLGAGATRNSTSLQVSGMRRYRLKVLQLTGAGPSTFNLLDVNFNNAPGAPWVTVAAIAALATGTRAVYDFGEGTANLTNFMGPFLVLQIVNNGGDAATYEIELWAQS